MARKIYYDEKNIEWLKQNQNEIKLIALREFTPTFKGCSFPVTTRYLVAYRVNDKDFEKGICLASFPYDIEGKTAVKRILTIVGRDFINTSLGVIVNLNHLVDFGLSPNYNSRNNDKFFNLSFNDDSYWRSNFSAIAEYYQRDLERLNSRFCEKGSNSVHER